MSHFLKKLVSSVCTLSVLLQALPALAATSSNYAIRVPVTSTVHIATTTDIDFGNLLIGTSASRVITFTNRGTDATTVQSVSTQGQPVQLSENTCTPGLKLASQATCSVKVTMAPTVVGRYDSVLQITHSAAALPDTYALHSTGVSASTALRFDQSWLQFDNQPVNTDSTTKTLVLKNYGQYPAVITAVSLGEGSSYFRIDGNDCERSLPPGATCSVGVVFAPRLLGVANSRVLLTLEDGTKLTGATLSGSGVQGIASWSASSVNFRGLTVGQPSDVQSVILANSGTGDLVLDSLAVTGDSSFSMVSTDCPKTLPAQRTCQVNLRVTPPDTDIRTAVLTLEASKAVTRVTKVQLYSQPQASDSRLEWTPGSLDFSRVNVGSSATLPLTLKSTGSAPVSVTQYSVTGTAASDFVISNASACTGTLAPGMQCTLMVRVAPTSDTLREAAVHVDGTSTVPFTDVTLKASGQAGRLTAVPADVALPSTEVGKTATASVTLANPGTAPVTISSPEVSSDLAVAVSVTGCAGTTLDVGKTCVATLSFAPKKIGVVTGSIAWYHTGAGGKASVNVTGAGKAAAAPVAALDNFICSPAPAAVGSASTCTSTLRNIGEVALTVGAWSRTNTTFGVPTSTCPATMAVGTSCPVSLTVTPTAAGSLTTGVSVVTGAGTMTAPVSLSSLTPSATLTTRSHGTVAVGSTDLRAQTVANNGSLPVKVLLPASVLTINTITLPNTGSTCTNNQTLNSGESCQVATLCAPTSAAKVSTLLRVNTSAGALTGTVDCTGELPPSTGTQLSVTPNPMNFGDLAVGGAGGNLTMQVANRGMTSVAITGSAISGADAAAFTITSNTCLKTLTPGSTCFVYLRAVPNGTGPREAALTLTANTSTPVPPVALRLNGTQGLLSVAPGDYDFDQVAVGSSKSQQFTLQNIGTAALRVDSVLPQGTDAARFAVLNNYCAGMTLLPNNKCTLSVVFTPVAEQSASAELRVGSTTSANKLVTASLKGRGYLPPVAKGTLAAQPDCAQAVQFGQKPACSLVLRSTGTADLVVSGFTVRRVSGDFVGTSSIASTSRDFTAITGGTFDAASGKLTLPPGASAVLTQSLSPYSTAVSGSAGAGAFSYQSLTSIVGNALTLTSNAPSAIVGTQSFKTTAPVFELTPAPAKLTVQVKQKGEYTVTLRNRGIDNVQFTAASQITGSVPYASWFAAGSAESCAGKTLAPGEACTATMACTPSMLGVTAVGTVKFMTSLDYVRPDGTHAVYSIPQSTALTCTGVAATATITAPNGKLSSLVATGSQSGNWRRFTNNGTGPVTLTEIAGSTDFLLYADPAQSTHCKVGMVVQPGQSCDLLEVVLKENVSSTAFNLSRTHYIRTDSGTFSWPAYYDVLGLNVLATYTDGNTLQRGGSRTVTLVLQNYTPSALSDMQFVTSSGTSVKDTTCTTLNSSGSCSVTLLVAPEYSTATSYTATLEVRGKFNRVYNGQVGPAAVTSTAAKYARTWTLTNPAVVVIPTPCSVCKTGTRPGGYTDFDWPIVNNGQEPIVFTGAPRIDGDVYFSVIRTTCQIALAAGRSCSPTIRFAPVPGVWGTRTANLVVPTAGGLLTFPISAYALPRGKVSVVSSSSNPSPTMNSSTDYSTLVTNTSVDGAPAQVTLNWTNTITPTTGQTSDTVLGTPMCFVTGVGSTCSIQGNSAIFNLAPGGTGTIRQHVTYGIVPCKHSRTSSAIINGVYDDNPDDDSSAISFDIGKSRVATNANGARQWSDGTVANSCQTYMSGDGYHQYAGDTGSGYYVVDPDGSGPQPATSVWCDMTTDGGGWTCPHSEDVATASKTWYSTVNDRGLTYNQLLLWAGSEHSMDYAVPWSNNAWESRGLSIAQTVLQFDAKGYVSKSTPAWRGCGASDTGAVTLPGRQTGYLPDSAYRNLSPQNQCMLGSSNFPSQCSNLMTVNVPYAGARLRAIGDVESASSQCQDDNLIRRQYSVCFRYNANITPAEVAEPKGGIIQVGATRTWFDGTLATSCRAYRKGDGGAGHLYQGATGDGTYRIDTDGSGPLPAVDVWCDMTSDNGAGYTELAQTSGSANHARDAEAQCARSGLQLFVPRSDQHFSAARAHYGVQNFSIMGIYPKFRGAACQGNSLHSGSCANWGPLNGGSWFVQSGVNVSEPNGDNDTDGSMAYWYNNGNVSWYNDISDTNNGGYNASQFVCSARDEGGLGASAVASVSQDGSRGALLDVGRNRAWAVPQYGAVWLWPDRNAAYGDMGPQTCMQTTLNNSYGTGINVTLTGAADNWADLYIDGSGVGRLTGFGEIASLSTGLSPGRHVLRAMVYNSGGPAGLTMWATRTGTNELLTATHPANGWTRCD